MSESEQEYFKKREQERAERRRFLEESKLQVAKDNKIETEMTELPLREENVHGTEVCKDYRNLINPNWNIPVYISTFLFLCCLFPSVEFRFFVACALIVFSYSIFLPIMALYKFFKEISARKNECVDVKAFTIKSEKTRIRRKGADRVYFQPVVAYVYNGVKYVASMHERNPEDYRKGEVVDIKVEKENPHIIRSAGLYELYIGLAKSCLSLVITVIMWGMPLLVALYA